MIDDEILLGRYLETGSEEAFSSLVSRYVDLVYSVAIRVVAGDAHLANDVVQTVFIDLSAKASKLPHKVVLGGWLCRHAFFVASSRIRTEQRRRQREREAVQVNTSDAEVEPHWESLSGVLDEALQSLGTPDRDALVLRYFEGRDHKYIGAAFGLNEDAAQKRVFRALQKLRSNFLNRGDLILAAVGIAEATTACNK